TSSGPSRFRDQQAPRRRQEVGRHIIIEQALARARPVDALGDAEGDLAAEYRPAAVAGDAAWSFDRHPGRRAGTAAQIAGRRIIGQLDRRTAVARALAIMTDEVSRARAREVAPADEPAERSGTAVGIEQRIRRIRAAVDLDVAVGRAPRADHRQIDTRAVAIDVGQIVRTMSGGGYRVGRAIGDDEAAGAQVAAVGLKVQSLDPAAAVDAHVGFVELVDDHSDRNLADL